LPPPLNTALVGIGYTIVDLIDSVLINIP